MSIAHFWKMFKVLWVVAGKYRNAFLFELKNLDSIITIRALSPRNFLTRFLFILNNAVCNNIVEISIYILTSISATTGELFFCSIWLVQIAYNLQLDILEQQPQRKRWLILAMLHSLIELYRKWINSLCKLLRIYTFKYSENIWCKI